MTLLIKFYHMKIGQIFKLKKMIGNGHEFGFLLNDGFIAKMTIVKLYYFII